MKSLLSISLPEDLPEISFFQSVEWDDFVTLATETQRRDLRLVTPWFIKQRVRPSTLSQMNFDQTFVKCLSNTNCNHNEHQVRYIFNRFANIFNYVISKSFMMHPFLKKIDGPQDFQRQEKQIFRDRYKFCLSKYVMDRSKTKKNSINVISRSEENGLFNCVYAATSEKISINLLEDLLVGRTMTSIMDWCDQSDLDGRSLQMMTALSWLALNAGDEKARKRAVQKAKTLRSDLSLPASKLHNIVQYAGDKRFFQFVRRFQSVIDLHHDFKISTMKAMTPYVSSVAALVMIFAPTTIEILQAAKFNGVPRKGLFGHRPTLAIADGIDNIEEPLSEGLVQCIDRIFEKYRTIFEKPKFLFINIDGSPRNRNQITSSIEIILRKIDPNLTVHDLRDVGVVQLLKGKETILTIAVASRINISTAEDRFKTLQIAISQLTSNNRLAGSS